MHALPQRTPEVGKLIYLFLLLDVVFALSSSIPCTSFLARSSHNLGAVAFCTVIKNDNNDIMPERLPQKPYPSEGMRSRDGRTSRILIGSVRALSGTFHDFRASGGNFRALGGTFHDIRSTP